MHLPMNLGVLSVMTRFIQKLDTHVLIMRITVYVRDITLAAILGGGLRSDHENWKSINPDEPYTIAYRIFPVNSHFKCSGWANKLRARSPNQCYGYTLAPGTVETCFGTKFSSESS